MSESYDSAAWVLERHKWLCNRIATLASQRSLVLESLLAIQEKIDAMDELLAEHQASNPPLEDHAETA